MIQIISFNKQMYFFITIILLSIFVSCSEGETNTSVHSSALPHAEALQDSKLTEAEKIKIAGAKGKEAKSIDVFDVEQMFDASEGRLHLFSFWKNDCESCKQSLESLNSALEEIPNEKYRWVLINMDKKDQLGKVNTYIRTQNIFGETYHFLPKRKKWFEGLNSDWDGAIPATFFVKENEEINIFINKAVESNELLAMLNSLIL